MPKVGEVTVHKILCKLGTKVPKENKMKSAKLISMKCIEEVKLCLKIKNNT